MAASFRKCVRCSADDLCMTSEYRESDSKGCGAVCSLITLAVLWCNTLIGLKCLWTKYSRPHFFLQQLLCTWKLVIHVLNLKWVCYHSMVHWKRKDVEFSLPTAGKRHFMSKVFLRSPSTNLSRKGNSMSSLDGITFSIAQGSTFSPPVHQVIHLCGLAFGYRRFPKDSPAKKFQVCDVHGAQYLLRLCQRGADSNLW